MNQQLHRSSHPSSLLLASVLCLFVAAASLRAADPIDALITGGIHPTATRIEKNYRLAVTPFKQTTYVQVNNTETAYFPTQRLDTLTWAISGPTLGLKITSLGLTSSGNAAGASIEPAGPLEDVTPGVLKVTATDAYAVTKTVELQVGQGEGQGDCANGDCKGGGAAANGALVLDPVKTGVIPFTKVPLTKPDQVDPVHTGLCPSTGFIPGPDFPAPGGKAGGGFNLAAELADHLEHGGNEGDFGAAFPLNNSVGLQVSLGRCDFGMFAGTLAIKESYPTNLLGTPSCLVFPWKTNADCEVITNGAGIRQVKVPEGLADISTNTAFKYHINFYPTGGVGAKVSGLYQTSGIPLVCVTIENPDSANTNKLRITDGDGYVSNYEWKTTGWELSKGVGYGVEFKPTTNSGTTRLITSETRQDGSLLVAASANKYDNTWPFGEKLIEQRLGAGAESLTNTYTYYTNGYATGLVQQVTLAQGYWEYHQYETNRLLTNTCVAYLNAAPTTDGLLCRRFEYAYGTNAVPGAGDTGEIQAATPRSIVEYVLNHEVSRRYIIFRPGERQDIRCTVPGATLTTAGNLTNTTRWNTNGTNIGRLLSVERPDGTMQILQYGFGTGDGGLSLRSNVVLSGAPNAGKTDISDGTRSVTVLGPFGQFFSRTNYDILSGIVLSSETVTNHDSFHRPRQISYLDGKSEGFEYGCCGPVTHTNREGTVTTYGRDPIGRTASRTTIGITQSNWLDAAGRVLQRQRIAGSTTILQTNAFDSAGRLLRSQDAAGSMATNLEAVLNNQLIRTNLQPDGATRISTYYRDGSLCKMTGTAVHGTRHTNGVEEVDGVWRVWQQLIKLDASDNDTGENYKTWLDHLGRVFRTVHSGLATNQSFYNAKGQLEKQTDPDGVTTLLVYNSKGEVEDRVLDVDRDGVVDYGGEDRIIRTVTTVANNGVKDVVRTSTYVWATYNSAISNLVSVTERSTDGTRTWSSSYGVTNNTETTRPGSGERYQISRAPDGSAVVSYFDDEQLKIVTRTNAAGVQLSQTTFGYDSQGRQTTVTDARNGTTTYAYTNEQIVSVTSPTPGNGQPAQTTTYSYDANGRRIRTVLPDGGGVTNVFHPTGELATNYGARAYPAAYTYDQSGRRKTLKTWKDFANNSGTATTTWHYNNLGQMTNKVYDDGNGPIHFYSHAGRLEHRKWARGVWTTNSYSDAGDLTATTYSDGTSNVLYNLDRQGRRTNIVDGAGTRYFTHTAGGLPLLETNASGTLAGVAISYAYDQFLRRTNVSLLTNGTLLARHAYLYDSASRLTNVSDGTHNAGYEYLANSALVQQIAFRSNSTARMTTTKQYDYLNRLLSITSMGSTGASPVEDASTTASFAYLYNDANQRVRVTHADGSYWFYEYDKLGQLIYGKHFWPDHTPVAGQQYEYAYDDDGNRTSTKEGGDASGTGLRSATYGANALNQYTNRTVPGAADILGIANVGASVTVNSLSTYRKDEYLWKELSIHNTNSAMWTNATILASLSGTTNTNSGNIFLPKTAETFTHDLDGNLTSDGRWTNLWDAENRLLQTESLSSAPTASKRKVTWECDGNGRRIRQTTSDGSSGSYVVSEDLKSAYDGWSCLADLNATNNSALRTYLWGLDISGSLTGAGGVGGLLAMNSAAGGSHFYAMDGNGNVAALIDATTGTRSANHEYSPFGQTIRSSGTTTTENRYRFSTKKANDTTDSLAYEFRHYRPQTGRWLTRDPIMEEGGVNILAYTKNAPQSHVDPLGLELHIDALVCIAPSRTCIIIESGLDTISTVVASGWEPVFTDEDVLKDGICHTKSCTWKLFYDDINEQSVYRERKRVVSVTAWVPDPDQPWWGAPMPHLVPVLGGTVSTEYDRTTVLATRQYRQYTDAVLISCLELPNFKSIWECCSPRQRIAPIF